MSSSENDPERRIERCLTDPSRKSPRGPHRYAYTEQQFDRRLKDEASLPLMEDQLSAPALLQDQLRRDQTEDLLSQLGLTERQRRICRWRMEGWTMTEIAEELGISERRGWALLKELRTILQVRIGQMDAGDEPGSSPYYGWQELFLSSQRKQ